MNEFTGPESSFNQIDRERVIGGEQKECRFPYAEKCTLSVDGKITRDTTCGEDEYIPGQSEFNIFMTSLVKHTNERAAIFENNQHYVPGTYVSLYSTDPEIWKIEDVVLHPDYWTNIGQNRYVINGRVNRADDNTKIYMINDDGTVTDTGLHTWTNDMFMDIEATLDMEGVVKGAFTHSYIRPDVNLTDEIYAMYDKRRGTLKNTIRNFFASFPAGEFDVKEQYADYYKLPSQNNVEHHSNGVVFDGKIAHLDWLGHFLFGMNAAESIIDEEYGKVAAQGLSAIYSLEIKNWSITSDLEPLNMQYAWDLGIAQVGINKQTRIKTFENTQTNTKQEAYRMAAKKMQQIYSDAQGVSCTGNCNPIPGTDDIVICTDSSHRRLEFVFDDICDTKLPRLNGIDPVTGRNYLDHSGYYIRGGRM